MKLMLRSNAILFRPCISYQRNILFARNIANTGIIDDEQQAARAWLASYKNDNTLHRSCTVTFSRSGGPGGQHVNKTNSKATLRLALGDITPSPPQLILNQLANSRYSCDRGQSLVIQADGSRKQGENKAECFTKLDELVLACTSMVIRKETSPEQMKKVQKLQAASNQRRLVDKKYQSAKKSSRRGDE